MTLLGTLFSKLISMEYSTKFHLKQFVEEDPFNTNHTYLQGALTTTPSQDHEAYETIKESKVDYDLKVLFGRKYATKQCDN